MVVRVGIGSGLEARGHHSDGREESWHKMLNVAQRLGGEDS